VVTLEFVRLVAANFQVSKDYLLNDVVVRLGGVRVALRIRAGSRSPVSGSISGR
jgi:hypothetical protein